MKQFQPELLIPLLSIVLVLSIPLVRMYLESFNQFWRQEALLIVLHSQD
ncbi:MAG: hypothetical protein ACI81F_001983 [Thalassolituus oleivorans]|jgi:hypothetical protein